MSLSNSAIVDQTFEWPMVLYSVSPSTRRWKLPWMAWQSLTQGDLGCSLESPQVNSHAQRDGKTDEVLYCITILLYIYFTIYGIPKEILEHGLNKSKVPVPAFQRKKKQRQTEKNNFFSRPGVWCASWPWCMRRFCPIHPGSNSDSVTWSSMGSFWLRGVVTLFAA